jgi:hypothetical protein
MAKAIQGYGVEATKILQAFLNTVEAKKPPLVLYHYTNDAGLAGINENGRFWFSDIFALNDPSELRHGLGIAIDPLKSRATDARPEVASFASMFERFYLDAGSCGLWRRRAVGSGSPQPWRWRRAVRRP